MYGTNPLLPITLTCAKLQDRYNKNAEELAKDMMKLHGIIKENANERYKQKADKGNITRRPMEIRDYAWIHLRKARFPNIRKNKFMPRAIRPFQITEKIGEMHIRLTC